MKKTKVLMIIIIVLVAALAAMVIAMTVSHGNTAEESTESSQSEATIEQSTEYSGAEDTIPQGVFGEDSGISFSTLTPAPTNAAKNEQEVPDASDPFDAATEPDATESIYPSIPNMTAVG